MDLVKEMIDNNRNLAWFFIRELAHNLGGSDSRIVNLTQKHIRGRLAEALMVLRDNYGYEDDGATINIYMSREDLAILFHFDNALISTLIMCLIRDRKSVV